MNITVLPFAGKINKFYQQEFNVRVFFTIINKVDTDLQDTFYLNEITQPFTCRDLLGTCLIQSHYIGLLEDCYTTEPISRHNGFHLAIGVEDSHKDCLLSMPSRLSVLHEIEDMMGFTHAEVYLVESDSFGNDGDILPNTNYRQVVKLDPLWITNTISFSLVTGILRSLVVNTKFTKYDARTLIHCINDGNNTGSVQYEDEYFSDDEEDSIIYFLGVYLRNWKELHVGNGRSLFGIDLKDYKLIKYNSSLIYEGSRGELLHPLCKGSCGILWLLYIIINDFHSEMFCDMIKTLKGDLDGYSG